MNEDPPLVELIDEPDKSDRLPLVELLDRDGKPLSGVRLQVVQLLTGGSAHETNTRNGRQVDVQNMCRILGIDLHASNDTIKRQYRAAIARFHPDVLINEGVDQRDLDDLGWRMSQLKERLGV